ncbi:unnamed protein product [Allacma fusca]|uniref:Protein HIRA n=1 Tax=Allacma fusca TaxID=39272 RepID=A0A8J2MAW0_9HEXA|nr:unnamed protein product [Allacma fusca]
MKVMKPTWVNHEGLPIFAIDVHPEGTRFATGGQGNNTGGRISIWNIVPVLDEARSHDENIPKLLCELEFHACVNALRWSHHGLYLSSGGDDRTVEIYKCSSKYNGSSVLPSSNNPFAKASHEQWRSIATLSGHTGDILDVSWSPTDKYLASASIDNSIIIWDACNFPHMITQLRGHTSLVKGVTWDPIGKFVASQSDDRTLRIWRTGDWQLEHIVKEPFSECGGTTHVLRLDWSPDGMYLVSAHAMNAGGPTAQIVERTGWKTDKDFVGHRKAVVCVRFNRNILQREGNKAKTCFVALGSRDRAVSVWSAALKRPLVVLRDLFKNSIMDLSWSSCGTILTCCSYDGTVAVAQFAVSEIGKPISTNEVASLHQQTYGNNVMSTNYTCNLVQDVSILKGQMKHLQKQSAASEKSVKNSDIKKEPDQTVSNSDQQKESSADSKKDEPKNYDQNKDSEPESIATNGTDLSNTAPPSKVQPEPDGSSRHEMSNSSKTSSPVKGPVYKQIETVRNDGKRRITPQFLLPQDTSSSKLDDANSNVPNSSQCAFKTEASENAPDQEKGKDEDKETTTSITNDKAALLEARVTDAGTASEKLQEPAAVISKPRVSTGSGGSSDGAITAPKTSGLTSNNAQEKSIKAVAPGSAVLKRKRSVEEAEAKPPKKGKINNSGGISSNVTMPAPKAIPLQGKGRERAGMNDGAIPVVSGTDGGYPGAFSEGPGVAMGTSPSKILRTKLPAMKMEQNHLQVVVKKTGGYSLSVENHKRVGRFTSHSITCHHEKDSLDGLNWTICVESPICGMTGDAFRVVVLCEDCTCHVLDMKGRYSLPPVVVPNFPHSMIVREQFLMITTVKATLHMWNIHLKKNVIRSESLLPLLNQTCPGLGGKPVEISRSTILVGGVPLIILSNGKSYKFSPEMQSWMLFVNLTPSFASVDMNDQLLDKISPGHMAMWNGSARDVNYAAVSEAKLKLAGAIDAKKSADVKTCMHTLGVTLAREGLEPELRHLLQDLLGPCHSGVEYLSGKYSELSLKTLSSTLGSNTFLLTELRSGLAQFQSGLSEMLISSELDLSAALITNMYFLLCVSKQLRLFELLGCVISQFSRVAFNLYPCVLTFAIDFLRRLVESSRIEVIWFVFIRCSPGHCSGLLLL